MRDPAATVGGIIDKSSISIISSIYCVLMFTASSGRYYSNFKSVDFEVPR